MIITWYASQYKRVDANSPTPLAKQISACTEKRKERAWSVPANKGKREQQFNLNKPIQTPASLKAGKMSFH